MIDLKHYERILENGLMLDHYHVLCMVKDGEELPTSKRVQGFLNLLNKKGYIQDGALTDEGLVLVAGEISNVTPEDSTKVVVETDFTKWVMGLHKRCQNKLQELTGGRQVRDKIDKKPYPFLPNATDLAKVLHRVIVIYKTKDLDKMERAMMAHIDKCHRARSWFPLMKYYVMKNGQSEMITDMDSIDDKEPESKSTQKFV